MSSLQDIDAIKVLRTIAETYFSVHVIDLVNDTFYEYKTHEEISSFIKGNTNATANMRAVMENTVANNFKEQVLSFSDLRTIGQRLKGRKAIANEFVCKNVGWVKEKFIVMETDSDNNPTKVIHFIIEINDQKRRELLLERLSYRDALTGCFNRLAYNERLAPLKNKIEDDLVYMIFDVNCLKAINDHYGHDVGDELIMGSVECINKCIAKFGRVYRTGGDEFVAILKADEKQLAEINENLKQCLASWKGNKLQRIFVSSGYAEAREFPGTCIRKLAKIAEERMYKDKRDFYINNGIDRRSGKYFLDQLQFLKANESLEF